MGGRVLTEAEGIARSFDNLKILGWAGKTGRGHRLWRVLCRCGTVFESELYDLKTRKKVSCGCVRKAQWLYGSIRHGALTQDADKNLTRTWGIWHGMVRRCTDKRIKAYPHYGGRGIKVSDRWLIFENFLNDMGLSPPGHSIERVDNNGNYEKSNCVWLPRVDQGKNTRATIRIKMRGVVMCLKDACRLQNISYIPAFKAIRYKNRPIHAVLGLSEADVAVVQLPKLAIKESANDSDQ